MTTDNSTDRIARQGENQFGFIAWMGGIFNREQLGWFARFHVQPSETTFGIKVLQQHLLDQIFSSHGNATRCDDDIAFLQSRLEPILKQLFIIRNNIQIDKLAHVHWQH